MIKLLCPVPGARISQYFGENPWRYGYDGSGHHGIDYSVVVGTPVRAAADGVVTAGDQSGAGFGLYLRQEIAGGLLYYGHLSRVVKTGAVRAGEVIALSGNTGNSTAPHLHFELRVDGVAVDPLPQIMSEEEEAIMGAKTYLTYPQYQSPTEEKESSPTSQIGKRFKKLKLIDPDHGMAAYYPAEQFILARLYPAWGGAQGDDLERTYWLRGTKGAEEFAVQIKPRVLKCAALGLRHFELINEPVVTNLADAQALAAFCLRLAQIVNSWQLSLWIPSWSNGNPPELLGVELMVPAIREARAGGGGGCNHEYGAPSVMDGWPDMAGRCRQIIDRLYAAGLEREDSRGWWLITEAGIDGKILNNGKLGWETFKKSWVYPAQYGLPAGQLTTERYFLQIADFDNRIRAEVPEVGGIFLFVTHPYSDQQTYNVPLELLELVLASHVDETAGETPGSTYLPHYTEADVWEPAVVLEKSRWWLEEMQRQFEVGNTARADEIRLSLIQWMYSRENALKAS